jgi:spermidine/putrescine transport system ATP-binding protein
VVVRPEHAAIGEDRGGRGLPAVVENAVFVGTDTQYHLRLAGGEPFVVRRQNVSADMAPVAVGARLQVLLGEQAVQVLRD